VPISTDAEGYLGRECPNKDCLGYFKITPGPGLKGEAHCHCPYCGFTAHHRGFFTREQIEYATSVAFHRITDAFLRDLKTLEFDHPPRGTFGIGISMKVEGEPTPIRDYRENRLETEVVCDRCTLRYAIYGVFAFCPDCGVHNSLQILNKNLELYEKLLGLARQTEPAVAEHLTGNALEDAVSAFDGFGRETCRVRASSATTPAKAENVSFQNLAGAKKRVQELFGSNLSAALTPDEWDFACRCFQKRHLLAHGMGVVDEAYIQATQDPTAVVGRKVAIRPDEVLSLVGLLRKMGAHLLTRLPPP
jgi:hypothetical protein